MCYIQKIIIMILFFTVNFKVIFGNRSGKELTEGSIGVVQDLTPEFPLGFGQVLDDASNVFGNVVRKMLAKKRLLGFDVGNWYW